MPGGWRRRSLQLVALAALGLLAACPADQAGPRRLLPVVAGATPVGTKACLECHDDVPGAWAGTPHAVAITERGDGCEICHGAGSVHVESEEAGDIVGSEALRALDAGARSALCLTCHATKLPHASQSDHAVAGVSCWACHPGALHAHTPTTETVLAVDTGWEAMKADHGPLVTSGVGRREAAFCYQCHGDVEGDFLLQFHHPVPEGTMRCGDCHAVHGESLRVRALGEDERCLACHEEIRGPFIFEHLALEDGCTVCHTPHGSIVEKLLEQADNGLCEQCHFDARFPLIGAVDHTGFLSGGALCYDCHFQVHGSNTDENLNPLGIEERVRRGRLP